MKNTLLLLGFLGLFNACDWDWRHFNAYEFSLLDSDSSQVFDGRVESYDPVAKSMEVGLLFDANQGYTSFLVRRGMRSDSFKIYYNFDVVDDEVIFKNFRFESATIKRADINQVGPYRQDFPFIKLYLPK